MFFAKANNMQHCHCFLCLCQDVSGSLDDPRQGCVKKEVDIRWVCFWPQGSFPSFLFDLDWEDYISEPGHKPHLSNESTNRQTDRHFFFF